MRQITLLFLIAAFFCQSCTAQQAGTTLNPTVIPSNVVMEDATEMPTPSTIIDPVKQRSKVVTVAVGDVFAVTVPQGSSSWKVDYSSVFRLLTPAENMKEPGPEGWLFRAITMGKADIRLTAIAAECNQPCPPAPPITYVFTVDVTAP